MPKYVITPWKYHSDLVQVRREIFQLDSCAPPTDLRRHAVDWINAWKMRGDLPHPIESTGQLVDSILHHDAFQNSPFSIRAAYSAAFCRFVTRFTDVAQSGPIKKSMYQIAKEIDMPASFVELRHEATHGDLPSLPRLQRHVKLALDWLWEHHWSKIHDPEANMHLKEGPELAKSLTAVLERFLAKRKAEIKAKTAEKSDTASASGVACAAIVKECLGVPAPLATLVGVLVQEKMLIPSGRRMNDSMAGAFTIWGNLLRRISLHQGFFLRILVDHMIELLSQPSTPEPESDPFNEAAFKWLQHIFTADEWAQEQLDNSFDGLPEKVLQECISAPNTWTLQLAEELLSSIASERHANEWRRLVDFAQQQRDADVTMAEND